MCWWDPSTPILGGIASLSVSFLILSYILTYESIIQFEEEMEEGRPTNMTTHENTTAHNVINIMLK